MNKKNELIEMAKKNNNMLFVSDLEKNNIHRQYLKQLADEGIFVRVAKGIYSLENSEINEFYITGKQYKSGIFSHATALYFYQLTDRAPFSFDLTFVNNVRINNDFIKSHYVKKENHLLGQIELEIQKGLFIKIYNLERTICDIIKDKNKLDIQIFNDMMKELPKLKNINFNLLHEYSKILRIEKKVREYMEVLF